MFLPLRDVCVDVTFSVPCLWVAGSVLMGDDVVPRKAFITSNAGKLTAADLDV